MPSILNIRRSLPSSINQIFPAHRRPYSHPCPDVSQNAIYSGWWEWRLFKNILIKHGIGRVRCTNSATPDVYIRQRKVREHLEVRFQYAGIGSLEVPLEVPIDVLRNQIGYRLVTVILLRKLNWVWNRNSRFKVIVSQQIHPCSL